MTKEQKEQLAFINEKIDARNKKLRVVEREKEKFEDEILLPILKKKYEGKYFIYENGYSKEERWPLYCFVKKVISTRNILADTFQTTTKENSFKVNEKTGVWLLEQREITKSQYIRALKIFIKNANKLISNA